MRVRVLLVVLLAVSSFAWAEEPPKDLRQRLLDEPTPARMRAYHDALCQEPHYSGSPGEKRAAEYLASTMAGFGLKVEKHEFYPYLPVHEGAAVEVIEGDRRVSLAVKEAGLEADPFSGSEKAEAAWNAYSASGDVTAEVVYANYGTSADFEKLSEMGVDVAGKIVLIRYGRIYRGNKANAAEKAGAVGVLLFTDPDDAGYRLGIPYPDGGWANEHYIQRGSLHSIGYPGDPLTPSAPATKNAPRLAAGAVPLPRIPVHPLGWGAASKILSRMQGEGVPRSWQGGLPFAYRVSGGEGLKVRLQVKQRREIRKSLNVLGRIEGALYPEQEVVFGCHYDAWTFGAGDPNAGTIVLLEVARIFGEAAKAGLRPARTIVFANWSGEEFGILGSTEYCEEKQDELRKKTVAYINLDMAAMGPKFRASASPLMQTVVSSAAQAVPQLGRHGRVSAWEAWQEELGGAAPELHDLGGGSDHLSYMSRVGAPVAAMGAWGSSGVSYHSNYETLTWYRKVVGDDYEPARMVARIAGILALELADAPLIPYDVTRLAPALRSHVGAVGKAQADPEAAAKKLAGLEEAITRIEKAAGEASKRLEKLGKGGSDNEKLRAANQQLLELERGWLFDEGLVDRPWYKSLYNATDPHTGYGAWPLPLLREAFESGDEKRVNSTIALYLKTFNALADKLNALGAK